jgi:hypothetical protein
MTPARLAVGSVYVQNITNTANIFSYNRTYAKGATVLHMLRGIIGDETFFAILRTYAASPMVAYKSAVTDDFQAIAEQVSGRKLDYFFQQWIYGQGYPVYKATASPINGAKTVAIRLEQQNAITTATNPASFTMPVQLQIQSAAGDTIVTVFNDQANQTFVVPTKGTVTGVLVDPNNLLLKTVESVVLSPITAISEPAATTLRVYPNPTAETLTVDFSTQLAGPVSLRLTNALGQQVRLLTESILRAGDYTRTLSIHGLAAGRYILTVDEQNGQTNRVVLIR